MEQRATVVPLRPIDLAGEPGFTIGGASVDPVSRDVTVEGKSERMQPQALRVLIALHRKLGQPVTRDELAAYCWDGRIVGEDVINRCILILRRVAKRAGGFQIETIPKLGYRLVEKEGPTGGLRGWRAKTVWPLAAGLFAMAGAALLFLTNRPAPRAVQAPTVTVLPFTSSAGAPAAEQLAGDVRTTIANTLTEVGFPVRLDQSSGGNGGRRPDFLISGHVSSESPSTTVTVRMMESRLGIVVYSGSIEQDASSPARLVDRVAASVAASLSWTGALMALDRRRPSDPAVTAELMTVLSISREQRDYLRAYQIIRKVAPRAPDSAIAQVSLAMETGFALGQIPAGERKAAVLAARQAAERAKKLAPEFGDSHVAWCGLHADVRWAECEYQLRTAVRIDPTGTTPRSFLGSLLGSTGQHREGLHFMSMVRSADPYSPARLGHIIRMLEFNGQPQRADEEFQRAQRYWPNHKGISGNRVVGLAASGNFAGLERLAAGPIGATLPYDAAIIAVVLPAVRASDARSVRTACQRDELNSLTHYVCLAALSRLGDLDSAFAIADALYQNGVADTPDEEEAIWLQNPAGFQVSFLVSPVAAPMRRDPRFLELARRVGLLRYWRSGRLPDFCKERPEPICAHLR